MVMSAHRRRPPPRSIWHDLECGALPRRPAALARAGRRGGAGARRPACSTSARAPAAWRSTSPPPATSVTALDLDPAAARGAARARRGALPSRRVAADARELRARASATSTSAWCRCRRCSCCAAPPSARALFCAAPAAHLRAGALLALRDRDRGRAVRQPPTASLGPTPERARGRRRALREPRRPACAARGALIRIERERVVAARRRRAASRWRRRRTRRDRARALVTEAELCARRPAARGSAARARRRVIARDRGTRRQRGRDAPCLSRGPLRVCALYPDLMNIYADRGNLIVLERRCAWRGIGFELTASGLGEPLDGERHDLYYIGGGQDRDQRLCAEDLLATKRRRAARRPPRAARSCSASAAATSCSATPTRSTTSSIEGVGLLDLETVRERRPAADRQRRDRARRAPGRAAQVLAGFENHGGRTHLAPARQPLGRVLRATATTAAAASRARVTGNTIGTYLHGPLLPKNVWFADWLIARALGIDAGELAALDDEIEDATTRRDARRRRLRAAGPGVGLAGDGEAREALGQRAGSSARTRTPSGCPRARARRPARAARRGCRRRRRAPAARRGRSVCASSRSMRSRSSSRPSPVARAHEQRVADGAGAARARPSSSSRSALLSTSSRGRSPAPISSSVSSTAAASSRRLLLAAPRRRARGAAARRGASPRASPRTRRRAGGAACG